MAGELGPPDIRQIVNDKLIINITSPSGQGEEVNQAGAGQIGLGKQSRHCCEVHGN